MARDGLIRLGRLGDGDGAIIEDHGERLAWPHLPHRPPPTRTVHVPLRDGPITAPRAKWQVLRSAREDEQTVLDASPPQVDLEPRHHRRDRYFTARHRREDASALSPRGELRPARVQRHDHERDRQAHGEDRDRLLNEVQLITATVSHGRGEPKRQAHHHRDADHRDHQRPERPKREALGAPTPDRSDLRRAERPGLSARLLTEDLPRRVEARVISLMDSVALRQKTHGNGYYPTRRRLGARHAEPSSDLGPRRA